MATQQHPAFDPNQPIVAAELPRIGGLRKDYIGAVKGTEIGDDELRAAAEAEARSWSELDADGKIVAIEANAARVLADADGPSFDGSPGDGFLRGFGAAVERRFEGFPAVGLLIAIEDRSPNLVDVGAEPARLLELLAACIARPVLRPAVVGELAQAEFAFQLTR